MSVNTDIKPNNIFDNQEVPFADAVKTFLIDTKTAKFAIGYFYLDGFNLVKKDLQDVEKIQILMGDETSSKTKKEIKEGYDERERRRALSEYMKECLMRDLARIEDEDQKKRIKDLRDLIAEERADVKLYTDGKFHPKLYLFNGDKKIGMVGSSNFTKPGLIENVELNLVERSPTIVDELNAWFDLRWGKAEEFREDLIRIIESSGILDGLGDEVNRGLLEKIRWGVYVSPTELFKIMAYDILGGRVDLAKEKKILPLFQEIGTINAENKMKKYYGALVADSVGLGKSFIGSQVIKDFLYGNIDFWDGELKEKWNDKGKGVLLIVPAHLRKQWRDDVLLRNFFANCIVHSIDGEFYFRLVDREKGELGKVRIVSYSKFTRLTKDSLAKLSDDFDLILIDEAHRFRDENTNAWKNVQFLKKKLAYGGDNKVRNRFVLLSATPLNNRISDLVNIFKIFLDRDLRDLGRQGKNTMLFDNYERIKKDLKNTPSNPDLRIRLSKTVKQIKNEILDDLMILRTRTYIKREYKDTKINDRLLIFRDPKVNPVKYDKDLTEYYAEYLDLYTGLSEFLEKLEYPYIDLFLIEERRKGSLRALLKILLLKRIESSIYSFDESINHIKEKEEFLLQLLERVGSLSGIRDEWQKRYGKRGEDEVEEGEEISGEFIDRTSEISDDRKELDIGSLKDKTKKDLELIKEYIKKIDRVKLKEDVNEYKDPKLNKLKLVLLNILKNGGGRPKILLFTQFKDTANYLHRNLSEWVDRQSSSSMRNLKMDIVTGDIDSERKEKIMNRFAPIANDYAIKDGEDEIDFLISTDALSEGVNLQDASIIINYDLPWNPMRIVQRVGRVNRIGSDNQVYVYNFFPDRDLEELLRLMEKLLGKIEDVKNLLAKEMQILSEEEDVTIDTIGETIRNVRNETDISKLEDNLRNKEFKDADVYGEDEETKQKLRIISKLLELGITEREFSELGEKVGITPFYTIVEDGKIVRLYKVFDKLRNEKMRDFVVTFDGESCMEADKDSIIELTYCERWKSVLDLDTAQMSDLRKNVIEMENRFRDGMFKDYTKLFTPLRQGRIQSFEGLHRKVVGYLRGVKGQSRLVESVNSEEELLKILHIYTSMKLRTHEVKYLKDVFFDEGINLEKDDLKKHSLDVIIGALERFYIEYLSLQPDIYFGGIRTEKDLDYSVVGWYA